MECQVKHPYFSQHYIFSNNINKYWNYTSRVINKNTFLYFVVRTITEVYQNSTKEEFIFLTKHQLKSYLSPIEKKHVVLGFWKTAPMHITGNCGPYEIRQRIALEKNIYILRFGTRVLLDSNSYIPWKIGSILLRKTPFITKFFPSTSTNDITSGIPRIVTLLELKSKTKVRLLLKVLYIRFLEQRYSYGIACRKANHFCQRVVIDSVQKIYHIRGIVLKEQYLELLLCCMIFAKVIEDYTQKKRIISGEIYPLEILERVNYTRVTYNLLNKNHYLKWHSKIMYKPILSGLQNRPLNGRGFLSVVSFERMSSIFAQIILQNRKDFLLNFKRNLILIRQK